LFFFDFAAPSVDEVVRKVAKMVKGKVLIGHSIDNDLSVLRLEDHPEIRDTALYDFL
jgi:DNA polymerase III epsilon subunit-like protein